jgi:hypothetical protein
MEMMNALENRVGKTSATNLCINDEKLVDGWTLQKAKNRYDGCLGQVEQFYNTFGNHESLNNYDIFEAYPNKK